MTTKKSGTAAGALGLAFFLAGSAAAQTTRIVEFPDPALFFQNTTFAVDGDVGFVPSFDADVLWSFSIATAAPIDPDGLALPAPGTASDVFLFGGGRAAIPGWFPDQGVLVADVSDPSDLSILGVIGVGPTSNVQGQNIAVDAAGAIGYVASFPNDTLFSINVTTLSLEDPDGLVLPGNPDRIALAGDRLAIVDTTNGRIMVVDVSDPGDLAYAGAIELPPGSTFGSNDNIVFADDGHTGFVSSNQRVLYSFDVCTLTLVDPDGVAFGTEQSGDHIGRHGDVIACIWSRGLAFADVSDPAAMTIMSNANFGGTVAPQGSATVAFTADGSGVAIPVIFPGHLVYRFDVGSGAALGPARAVGEQPNFLAMLPGDEVAVICSGVDEDTIHLVAGLFPDPADVNGDGLVNVSDLVAIILAWGVCADPGDCPEDVDADGLVGVGDLVEVITSWSP